MVDVSTQAACTIASSAFPCFAPAKHGVETESLGQGWDEEGSGTEDGLPTTGDTTEPTTSIDDAIHGGWSAKLLLYTLNGNLLLCILRPVVVRGIGPLSGGFIRKKGGVRKPSLVHVL